MGRRGGIHKRGGGSQTRHPGRALSGTNGRVVGPDFRLLDYWLNWGQIEELPVRLPGQPVSPISSSSRDGLSPSSLEQPRAQPIVVSRLNTATSHLRSRRNLLRTVAAPMVCAFAVPIAFYLFPKSTTLEPVSSPSPTFERREASARAEPAPLLSLSSAANAVIPPPGVSFVEPARPESAPAESLAEAASVASKPIAVLELSPTSPLIAQQRDAGQTHAHAADATQEEEMEPCRRAPLPGFCDWLGSAGPLY
jgi:hypothetical protein